MPESHTAHAPSAKVGVSVVVPAYNESRRIGKTLEHFCAYLDRHYRGWEVWVVDDGSSDDTAERVRAFEQIQSSVKLLQLSHNQGKGAAVQAGMLRSEGERILFSDADASTPIEELEKLMHAMDQGSDVVVGSRALPGSELRRRQPLPRELMGRTFNLLVRMLLQLSIHDTQCGFKLFTREAARGLFSQQTNMGFAFDVEILMLATQQGLRVTEVPVVWLHNSDSKVNPVVDALKMLRDIVQLRIGHWRSQRRTGS